MTIPRIIFDKHIDTLEAKITGNDHHYLRKILRMREGERLFIAAPNGEFLALIAKSTARETVVKIMEALVEVACPAACRLTLVQALLKTDKMELIAQKASELGVNSFAPFISERSISRPTADKLAAKRSRWEHISREAARKSRRLAPMLVQAIEPFEQMLVSAANEAVKIIFWEEETALLLGDFLSSPSFLPAGTGEVFFIVGPEGGFTSAEVMAAKTAGFTSISLGKALLKAETAAIAGIAILSYATGEYGGNTANSGRAKS